MDGVDGSRGIRVERERRLPKEGLLLAQQSVAFPKGRAPGGHFAEIRVSLAGERELGPGSEPAARFDLGLEHGLARSFALKDSAQFQPELERFYRRAFGLPMHIKKQPGAFLGVLAEQILVSVPFVQAGREGVASFKIQEEGKHFDHSAARGARRQREHHPKSHDQTSAYPSHTPQITAPRPELNAFR